MAYQPKKRGSSLFLPGWYCFQHFAESGTHRCPSSRHSHARKGQRWMDLGSRYSIEVLSAQARETTMGGRAQFIIDNPGRSAFGTRLAPTRFTPAWGKTRRRPTKWVILGMRNPETFPGTTRRVALVSKQVVLEKPNCFRTLRGDDMVIHCSLKTVTMRHIIRMSPQMIEPRSLRVKMCLLRL